MSAGKPTPGPWRIGPRHKDGGSLQVPIVCNGGSAIAWVNNREWASKFETDGEQANALLISAAPELLEACKAALAWFVDEARASHDDEYGPFDESKLGTVPAALRAAIAKAEGRT